MFLPDLAASLNNLSNQQSDNGDRAGALASIGEAVTLRRALADLDSADRVTRLVSDWIVTRTWDDSKRYLNDHRAELHSEEAMELLASQTDSTEALRHLGILGLDPVLGPDATYTVVTDPTAGEAHIEQAIRSGSIAILALVADDPQTAESHAQAAADNATPLRREAINIHLRGLAAAQPEHREAIAKLIEIFAHAGRTN